MPEEPGNKEVYDGLSTPRPDPSPGRWCLLRHDLPDGTWHLDLMIAPHRDRLTPDSARPLFTLQLPGSSSPLPNAPDCQGFVAERIADHRAVYLQYEGSISENRGAVVRLASGTAADARLEIIGGREVLLVSFAERQFRSLTRVSGGLLRFEREV